jgi:hypothetical protein
MFDFDFFFNSFFLVPHMIGYFKSQKLDYYIGWFFILKNLDI